MNYSNDPQYRLLQLFLGRSEERAEVFEVYVRIPGRTLYCTCPGYRLRHYCKHTEYVKTKMEAENGYSPPLTKGARGTLTPAIMDNPQDFRRWLYDHGHVVMLED